MASPPDAVRLVRRAAIRQRNIRIAWGAALAAGGLAGLGALPGFEAAHHRLLASLAALAALAGVGLAGVSLLRFDVMREDLLRVLTEAPERIVWVYPYKVEFMPYGVRVLHRAIIYFRLDDGGKLGLPARATDLPGLIDALRLLLPHTTFGHSAEKEQLYRANPDLLRR